MQSESFEQIYKTDDNCVISSPTGSGKTVVFELAIIKLLTLKLNNPDYNIKNSKILYMAPTKALCNERYDDWCNKFKSLNCNVGLLTGDSSFVELDSVKKSDLIVCTPEKWDALTRRWSDYSKLLDLVKLLLVDEIHFLREKRGTSLEVVITRMKTMSLNLRIIALSATVPNIYDVSNWLGNSNGGSNNNNNSNIQTLVYDDSYRAVKLNKTVYGYKTAGTSNPFKFEMFLNGKLPEVLKLHSKNKPVLIFCPTRNSSIATAKFLLKDYSMPDNNNSIPNIPTGINKEISELIQKGIAYHHAGLTAGERKFIEENFIKGNIKILCSTSTLAVGVNLPAYLVIIKGTKVWNNESMEEYNELDLMQMMGRAGRPQFETEGACVIMTDSSQKDRYLRLVKGTEKLESSLHLNIYENVTAEITLKTITSLESAFNWLQSTFFYQRYMQNPTGYPLILSKVNSNHPLEVQLRIYLKDVIDELIREKIIEVVDKQFVCTVYGNALSKSYVLYETIKNIIQRKDQMSLGDCLTLLSKSHEFENLRVKMAQRKLYKEINQNPLMFKPLPNSNKIETPAEKVSIIIQYELGGIQYPTYQGSMKLHHEFVSERLMIFKNLLRIIKAAIEILVFEKDSISLQSMLKFNRCICAKSWENTSLVLKQFDGIGLAYAKKLMSKKITTVAELKKLPRDKLEYYLGLKPGAGQKIAKSIANMPELSLKVENLKLNNNGLVEFEVYVDLLNKDNNISFIWNGCFVHINVLTDVGGEIFDFRRLPLKKLVGGKRFTLKINLKYKSDYVKIHFNCDEIAAVGQSCEVDVSKAVSCLPNKPGNSLNKVEDNKSDDDNSSFVFDDADDIALGLLDDDDSKVGTVGTSKKIENNTPKLDTQNSKIETSDTSLSTEPSFMDCAHKCVDKQKCRHICCKEGIPTNKVKSCKHACKDKSKCRHMCCREQFEYEAKTKAKAARQNTLDLSLLSKGKSAANSFMELDKRANNVSSYEEIESSSDDELLSKKPAVQSNAKVAELPVFLKKIEQRVPLKDITNRAVNQKSNSEIKFKRLETSKYFNDAFKVSNPTNTNESKLLDMSEDDSDDFSDSFDGALNMVLTSRKRVQKISKNDNFKRTKLMKPQNEVKNTTDIASAVRIAKQKPLEKIEKKNVELINPNRNRIMSVEDVVITNLELPKVNKLSTIVSNKRVKPHESKSYEKTFDSSNGSIENLEDTVMTSTTDIHINPKEVLGFLDSDIEFD